MQNDKTYKKKNWSFLSLTSRVCLYISILLFILLIIQTLFGKFEGIEFAAWLHLILLVFPIVVVQWLARKKTKFSGIIIPKQYHKIIIAATSSYFVLVLVSILIEPFFYYTSILDYKVISFLLLVPFEFALLFYYRKIFFTNKYEIVPNREIIYQFINVKEKEINEIEHKNDKIDNFISKCYNLVAENNLDFALKIMRAEFEKNNFEKNKNTILLQRQISEISNNVNLGTLSIQDAHIFYNRIALAILEIVST